MVVADADQQSATETLGSLQTGGRGQGHMVAVVDVSSRDSVKKLVTSIQVCVGGEDSQHTHSPLTHYFVSQLPPAGPFLPATFGVCECSRHHAGRLPAQHGGGEV